MTRVQIWNNTIVKANNLFNSIMPEVIWHCNKLHNTGGTNIHGSFFTEPTVHIQSPQSDNRAWMPTARCRPQRTKSSEPCSAWTKENETWLDSHGPQSLEFVYQQKLMSSWPQWLQVPCWNLCPTIHTKSSFSFSYAFHFIFKLLSWILAHLPGIQIFV